MACGAIRSLSLLAVSLIGSSSVMGRVRQLQYRYPSEIEIEYCSFPCCKRFLSFSSELKHVIIYRSIGSDRKSQCKGMPIVLGVMVCAQDTIHGG